MLQSPFDRFITTVIGHGTKNAVWLLSILRSLRPLFHSLLALPHIVSCHRHLQLMHSFSGPFIFGGSRNRHLLQKTGCKTTILIERSATAILMQGKGGGGCTEPVSALFSTRPAHKTRPALFARAMDLTWQVSPVNPNYGFVITGFFHLSLQICISMELGGGGGGSRLRGGAGCFISC